MAKLRVKKVDTGGGPDKPNTPIGSTIRPPISGELPAASKLDDDVHIRDAIHSFISRKDKNLSSEESIADYKYLASKMGAPLAQKLVSHVMLFNNRPDIQQLPFDGRLNSYYSIGSNDPEISAILKKNKQLGYGPTAATLSSPDVSTMAATGRLAGK